ncbi:CATRA conflict system CASPASE/TPR repeat-associated protein [Parafrankia sp. CH37]|nr:CATRA conflict system CASPASE/TPR repeat-associated protein [Parafrankia sp. CH37]
MDHGHSQLLVAPELVVHVFGPTRGPHSAAVYDYLTRIWRACADELGMRHPIEALGVPRLPPPRHELDVTEVRAPVAAQRRVGDGVFQSLLRREHDVLCLSVMLAPPPTDPTGSWADLSGRWARVCQPVPDTLLGIAEVYQARLARPEPPDLGPTTAQQRPSRELAASCRLLLPEPAVRPSFDSSGVATSNGFAVWEASSEDDTRSTRRAVVVAGHDRDAELSSWTWNRGGDMAVTPFARYLMHASKLRYHLRVWSGGQPLRGLRDDVERAVEPVARLIDDRFGASAGDRLAGQPTSSDEVLLATLRLETYRLDSGVTQLRKLRRSVDIAAANMANYVPAGPSSVGQPAVGLFADDHNLAGWFVQQLDDDLFYSTTTLRQARETIAMADSLPPATLDGSRGLPKPSAPERRTESGVRPGAGVSASRVPGPLRVLVLADEWLPRRGGLSALNRYLCVALAKAGVSVYCVVPAADQFDRDDAAEMGVELLTALMAPGTAERDVLMRRPPLPTGVVPDVVIGHSRITGAHAKAVTEDHFPAARRLHFVHMSPDEIEWWRRDRGADAGALAENRTATELALGEDATRVVAVGPNLHQWMRRELSVFDDTPEPVRFDPGFDYPDGRPEHDDESRSGNGSGGGSGRFDRRSRTPPPGNPQILLLGRLEDASIKGLDIAARAVGYAVGLRGRSDPPADLLLRGAPPGQAQDVRDRILEWSGRPGLTVTVRNYSTESIRLQRDLRRASLVLMPSRVEGFGLVGLEAIAAGTPVLISDRSGLGTLLHEVLSELDADRMVVPVTNDEHDVARWGLAVHEVLRNRPAAFARAAAVRDLMRQRRSWGLAVEQLLSTLGPAASTATDD